MHAYAQTFDPQSSVNSTTDVFFMVTDKPFYGGYTSGGAIAVIVQTPAVVTPNAPFTPYNCPSCWFYFVLENFTSAQPFGVYSSAEVIGDDRRILSE